MVLEKQFNFNLLIFKEALLWMVILMFILVTVSLVI